MNLDELSGRVLVKDAARDVMGADCPTYSVRLRGVDVHCVVDIDVLEHARRQAEGVGAINDWRVLDAPNGLKPGVAVSSREVPAWGLRALRQAGGAVAKSGRGWVTREARVPLIVDVVVVTDTRWRRGVQRATRFGPYCQRVLALPRLPVDSTNLLLEAHYLGVGLWTAKATGAGLPGRAAGGLVLEPAPFVPQRFTAASWAFAEDAYRQILPGMT